MVGGPAASIVTALAELESFLGGATPLSSANAGRLELLHARSANRWAMRSKIMCTRSEFVCNRKMALLIYKLWLRTWYRILSDATSWKLTGQ